MPELDSLYLRVRLSPQAYERFLHSTTADARDFSDWMDWLGKARIHGQKLTRQGVAEIGKATPKRAVADAIAAWTGADRALARSEYDEATETWRLGVAHFSENFREYLEFLPLLRAVERFKDRPGIDFILVYDHFHRPNGYTVLLELTEAASRIAGSPGQDMPLPTDYAAEARAFLRSLAPAENDAG